jgi:hypothetical protein
LSSLLREKFFGRLFAVFVGFSVNMNKRDIPAGDSPRNILMEGIKNVKNNQNQKIFRVGETVA